MVRKNKINRVFKPPQTIKDLLDSTVCNHCGYFNDSDYKNCNKCREYQRKWKTKNRKKKELEAIFKTLPKKQEFIDFAPELYISFADRNQKSPFGFSPTQLGSNSYLLHGFAR